MVKKSKFFGPPCRNALADHDGSTPECAHCAGLCPTYWTTFGNAEKNRNGICPQHEWDHPHFWVFNSPSPSAPKGPMDPIGRKGTSADIVPTHIQFGEDPSTRCWDIAQKPPKCKNSPLTPIVTKILFPPFSVRRGPLTPKRGENTSGTTVRPHANFGVNRPAGCREIVDRTKQTNKTKHTVKQIPRPSV